MQFHETVMGQRFFQGQLPKLIKALEKIGAELERANDLKEKELAKKQKGAGQFLIEAKIDVLQMETAHMRRIK